MKNKLLLGLVGVAENSLGERIGSARVGKDVIGDYLVSSLGSWVKVSFAEPIYRIAEHAFGIPKSILDSPTHFEKEEKIYSPWGMTLRNILQEVGTELFRDNIDTDFWVKRAKMKLSPNKCQVFTDVRMENEAAMIRRMGGTIIHVHRMVETGKVKTHRSEQTVLVNLKDLHIYNNGTLTELNKEIDEILTYIKETKKHD